MRFQLSALSAPPSGSLGPSILWGLWLYHNIRILLQFSEVFSGYFHLVIQLVLFMTASDYSLHKRVVSRGMVSPVVVLVSHVGKHVVLSVHILALKVVSFLFHSPTLMLSQCTTYITIMLLPCICFIVLLSGVRRAIFSNI